jgi:secreted PhoX family phosphatase
VFGRMVDQTGATIHASDGSDFISPSNDFSSILDVNNTLYEITHFETQPGGMYISQLTQNAAGALTIASTRPVDFSTVHGLWNPCAGSVTPWNTHLGGEEYPQDARQTETATTVANVMGSSNVNMLRYFGLDPATATVTTARAAFKPYYYGFPVEVSVGTAGATTVKKHYAMGRRAVELAYVMPDRKTVYITDDGTNDSLQMFVAKTAGDLSEGRLYAARWFQTSAAGAPHGTADLYWIELGTSARSSDVQALVDGGITFSQIFDTQPLAVDGTCPVDYKSVNVDAAAPGECLKLKTGMELAASRLESRRYAAYLGGTTEFRKIEGITYNAEGHRLYISFSEVNNGAINNHARDLGGPNHMRLAENKCGAVFELTIAHDAVIGTDYVASNARALLEGIWLQDPANPNPYPAGSPYAGKNECAVSAIANPDNVTFIPQYHMLLVGEDSTAEHQNDAVWAYDTESGALDRIMTTPYGAETTGVYFYPNLRGHAYIKTQVQHPYGESDQAMMMDPAELRSYTGYIGPLPAMN